MAARYELKPTKFYFDLRAANKQMIGKSETYTTEAVMERALRLSRKTAQPPQSKT